jgi:hypothetical protein
VRRILAVSLLVLSTLSIFAQTKQAPPPVGFPVVVAQKDFTNQTTRIPKTLLFRPKKSALYRVTVNMLTTVGTGGTNDFWAGTIGYTDDSGSYTQQLWYLSASSPSNSNSQGSAPNLTFRANVGTPVTLSVDPSQGNPTGSSYEVFVIIEELN